MRDVTNENRTSIIDAVRSPLSFLVLMLLAIEVLLFAVLSSNKEHTVALAWVMFASLFATGILVTALAIRWPWALLGNQPLREWDSDALANNLYLSVDGYFSNLTDQERADAWSMVVETLKSSQSAHASHKMFSKLLADRLSVLASIAGRRVNTIGPIR